MFVLQICCVVVAVGSNMSQAQAQAQAPDARSQTFVDAFWPLQKLLDNNALSPSAYKAICAILEHELDNGQLQSEQDVINIVQSRSQAQVPQTGISNAPPSSQATPQAGSQGAVTASPGLPEEGNKSRGLGDGDQSRG